MKLVLFMDKSPRNSSLSMKLALFMDNCLLKCSLSMKLALFHGQVPSEPIFVHEAGSFYGRTFWGVFWDSVGR